MANIFYLLIVAQSFALVGGFIQTLALSWAASEGGGLSELAGYLLACYLPVALLSYPLGRFLDRRAIKPWLLGSESILAGLSLALWLIARGGGLSYPFLLVFGGGWGVVRAVQTPLYQSLPRRLSRSLSKGTALLTAVTYGARGLGPVLGGLLYAKFGASAPYLANFCSFIPSVALLCFLKIPAAPPSEPPRIKPLLLPLAQIFAVALFGTHYNLTFVALVKEAGLGSGAYGFALGLLGAGALIGCFWRLKSRRPIPRTLAVGAMGGLNWLLAAGAGLWWQGACILLYGFFDFWFFARSAYRLSRSAEQGQIGAVMGLYTVATVGAPPLGALLWSLCIERQGLRPTFLWLGAGLFLIAITEYLIKDGINETRT